MANKLTLKQIVAEMNKCDKEWVKSCQAGQHPVSAQDLNMWMVSIEAIIGEVE